MGCGASKSVKPSVERDSESSRAARLQRWNTSGPSLWRKNGEEATPPSVKGKKTGWDVIRQDILAKTRRDTSPTTKRAYRAYQAGSTLKIMDEWHEIARSMSMPAFSPSEKVRPSGEGKRSKSLMDRSPTKSHSRFLFELPAEPSEEELGPNAKAEDRFDDKELARYLLSRLSFTHPVSKRPLNIDECQRLDAHLMERGLQKLANVASAFGNRALAATRP